MKALALAAACVVAALALGRFARRAPIGCDAAVARASFGAATPLAWAFTQLGYARDLGALYLVLALVAWSLRPRDIHAVEVLAIAQVASQLVANGLKLVYQRERPEHWLKRHETTAGYPSGHATTAVVTFGGLALAALAPIDASIALGLRDAIALAGLACALGIAWSRLALGAHYLSDIAGGALIGIATLALAAATLPR